VLSSHGEGFLLTEVKHLRVVELNVQLGCVEVCAHGLSAELGQALKGHRLRVLNVVNLNTSRALVTVVLGPAVSMYMCRICWDMQAGSERGCHSTAQVVGCSTPYPDTTP